MDRLGLLEDILTRFGLWQGLAMPLRPRQDDTQFRDEFDWDGQRWVWVRSPQRELQELALGQNIEWERAPAVFGPGGMRQLSSGETAILRFAAQAVAAVEQGSLLLFDEPETHLHPNYISEFMEILQDLLDRTASVAIIATHSAYVVREVPRERVNVLAIRDGLPDIGHPRLQTFGASIDTISQFVFDDTRISHWHQARLQAWLAGPGNGLSLEQIIERHGAELNPETLSYIAELKRDAGV